PIDRGLGRLAVLELHLGRHGDLDYVRLAFLLLGKRAAYLLLRHDDFVLRLAHGIGQWCARKLELRLAYRLAPRPLDLVAKHLGDVLFAPGLRYVAGDVLARAVPRRDDVADLGFAASRVSFLAFSSGVSSGCFSAGAVAPGGNTVGLVSSAAEIARLSPRECREQTRNTESVPHSALLR